MMNPPPSVHRKLAGGGGSGGGGGMTAVTTTTTTTMTTTASSASSPHSPPPQRKRPRQSVPSSTSSPTLPPRRVGRDNRSEHHRPNSHAQYMQNNHTPNAIDEVMDEVEDLLQASREGQALGRLRNSYSSLLLAHQRLIGLGRRVDRSYCEAEGGSSGGMVVDGGAGGGVDDVDRGMATGGEASHPSITSASQSLSFAVANDATSTDANDANTTFLPPLVSQPPLPPNLTQHGEYADVAYVEYLSRSSMELHHRRTGRGMQHDAAVERAKLAERNRKLEEEQIVRAARGVYALSSTQSDGKGDGGEVGEGGNGGDGGDGEGNEDGMPAATVGTRVVSDSGGGRKRKDSEGGDNDEDYEEEDDGRGRGGGRGRIGSSGGDDGGEDGDLTPSKRKGGRGKKPPTLVMHTMAGRSLDVRELMRGIL